MPKGTPADLVGQRFGEWTVLGREGTVAEGIVMWLCVCSCGNTASVQTGNLTSGKSTRCRSCGNRKGYNKRWG